MPTWPPPAEEQTQESSVYRRLIKGAVAVGAIYGASRVLPGLLKPMAIRAGGFLRQSPTWRTAEGQFAGGNLTSGLGTLWRGIKSAGEEDILWATSPLRSTFGVRQPRTYEDINTLVNLFGHTPNPIGFASTATAWRARPVARANRITFGDVLANRITSITGRSVDLGNLPNSEANTSLGGLSTLRYRLLELSRLPSNKFPRGFLQSEILTKEVDPWLLKSTGGRTVDLRSFAPEHLLVDLPYRAQIPSSWNVNVPQFLQPLLGQQIPLGGSRPLYWMANLVAPTELLRTQPITQVLRSTFEEHHGSTFYAAGGNLHAFGVNVRRRDPAHPGRIITDYSVTAKRRGGAPLPDRRALQDLQNEPGVVDVNYFLSDTPAQTGVRLAHAQSALGKGVRMSRGMYAHSLSNYMQDMGIPPGSLRHKLLQGLDYLGVGPHLTSPEYEMGPGGVPHAKRKIGAFEEILRRFWTGSTVAPHTRLRPVLGEPDDWSFVHYSPQNKVSQAVDRRFGRNAGNFTQALSDYWNYSLMRPMYLLEEGFGIGMRAGRNPLETTARILGLIALPGYTAYQGASYLNYLADKATPGPSPYDLALGSYAGLQTTRAGISDTLGITDAARKLEDVLPGIFSSPLSWIARSIGGGYVFTMLMSKLLAGRNIPTSARLSLLTAAALVGTSVGAADPTIGKERLERIYSGEELVPIRKGRWWELGTSSFFGGAISYYRPHYIPLQKSKAWYAASYGSEEAYWAKGTLFPTPSNLFGLRKILDPYYLENLHAADRPYPYTTPLLGEVPIIGPALEGTIGRLLKPVREHPLLQSSMETMQQKWIGDRDLPRDVSERMGLGPTLPEDEGAIPRHAPTQIFGRAFKSAMDWMGLQGFMWGSITRSITGTNSPFGGERQYSSSGDIASTEEYFYGKELGGGFQTLPIPGSNLLATEFFRRMIPHKDRSIESINPIPNVAPEWLPGERSIFRKDREFYLEGGFHRGDPYTKLPSGYTRLPGPGYEAARPLHSGLPGVYSDVDRYLILKDIAPYSEGAKFYDTRVRGLMKAGELSDYWMRQVIDANLRSDQKDESKSPGSPNLWDGPGTMSFPVTVGDVLSPTTFTAPEVPYPIKLAGLEESREKLVYKQLYELNSKTVEQATRNVAGLHRTLRDRMESMQGQTINIQVARDQAARYENQRLLAIIPSVNQEFYRAGLGDKDEGGLAAYVRGGTAARRAGNLWYAGWSVANELPGPLGWPATKLMPMKSPLQEYYQYEVLRDRFGKWESPIESYIKPWARQTAGFFTDFVPEEKQERREVQDQFQLLRFVRATRNMAIAEQNHDQQLAMLFGKEAKRTYLGVNPRNAKDLASFAKQAVDPAEQPYIDDFAELRSTSERKRALSLTPPNMQYILSNMWASQLPQGESIASGRLRDAAATYNPDYYPQERVDEFLSSTHIPSGDWQGWNPAVGMTASKVKWIENRGDDVHNYGLWESDRRRVLRQFPSLPPPDISSDVVGLPTTYADNMSRLGLKQIDVRSVQFGSSGQWKRSVNIEIRKDRQSREKVYSGYQNQAAFREY